jgi:hypothetical protein
MTRCDTFVKVTTQLKYDIVRQVQMAFAILQKKNVYIDELGGKHLVIYDRISGIS